MFGNLVDRRQNHSAPNFEFPNELVLVVVVARDVGLLETDGSAPKPPNSGSWLELPTNDGSVVVDAPKSP